MILRQDVSDPEGPVCLPDGSWVITEMGRGIISHISADGGMKRELAHTGRPNGLALDGDGNLWVAESQFPALLRVTMSGVVTLISRGDPALPFLWPNDLCFGPDGAIYMTDSGIPVDALAGVEPPSAIYDMPIDGRIFRIDPVQGTYHLIDWGLRFANGIAFGPGGEDLYVAETLTGNIYRYRIVAGQVEGERQLFSNVMITPPSEHGRIAGPDGMAFDIEGNLYVAVLTQGDITVLSPDGSVKERLEIDGTFPTNVAFARPGERRILVTEGSKDQLLLLETPAEGLPLYEPKVSFEAEVGGDR
ncbi:MAG TPA: SMP-30/gluconolactonase/LRE family protein [Caldilineae bacterium]|nr:SMP-30/gluconolactonase/LRE family protein [Caldilineae bacterium]